MIKGKSIRELAGRWLRDDPSYAEAKKIADAEAAILNVLEALEREIGRPLDGVKIDAASDGYSVEIAVTRHSVCKST